MELVIYYFLCLGEFIINIMVWNFVSSSSKIFVLSILFILCDRFYCDIWVLERIFLEEIIIKIVLLVWFFE